MPVWAKVTIAATVAIAFVAATTVAVVQTARLRDVQRILAMQLAERPAPAPPDAGAAPPSAPAPSEPEAPAPPSASDTAAPEDPAGEEDPALGGLEDMLDEDAGILEDLMEALGGGGTDGPLGEDLGALGELFGGGGGPLEQAAAGLVACIDPAGLGSDPVEGDDLDAQVDAVSARVEELRGLEFPEPVEVELMTSAEIEDFFTELVAEEYPADTAELDARVLAALGAVQPGTDLLGVQQELLSAQVAGFYDPDTERLVVRADDPDAALEPTGLLILAHELEHAVIDATLELPDLDDGPADDEALAQLALVEGDAVLLQNQFAIGALSLPDQLATAMDPEILESQEQLESVPAYVRDSLLFPYTAGAGFACALQSDGGWEAVDAAFEDPPATTAEILFPERYLAGVEPVEVVAPAGPGAGWEAEEPRTFGAAELLFLFSAPGDDPDAALEDVQELVADWAGGSLGAWTRGGDTAVALVLAQDAAGGLCDTLTAWHEAAFPDGADLGAEGGEAFARGSGTGAAVLRCTDTEVRLGLGPDVATARAAIA